MRRSQLKRTEFKRPKPPESRAQTLRVVPGAFRAPQPIDSHVRAVTKDRAQRSEPYRRAVASLPCVICGVPGYSQAAHGGEGKGMGIKACDMKLFPACCDRPGIRGCHSRLDQGALFSKLVRRELEPAWIADTQRKIYSMGLWPQKLPYTDVVDAIIKEIRA